MISTFDLYRHYLKNPHICIDSRQVKPGDFFVALRGEHFDGNEFAAQALEKGAALALIDRPEQKISDRYLLVEDCLQSLQQLATYHRRQFDIPFIGITGSNGKTTTKELVRDVLAQRYRVHATVGNYNNHIGVPLTLLALPEEAEMAVIEMGANAQGEIDLLSNITEPDYGLITNIGKAHLEGFGGIEGVKKGKSELYRFLHAAGGTVFLNRDERFLQDLLPAGTPQINYGSATPPYSRHEDFGFEKRKDGDRIGFRFEDEHGKLREGFTHLFGDYNFGNITTALAVGLYFGVPGSDIARAISDYRPELHRSQIIRHGGLVIIMDAYNANPSSMTGALRSFSTFRGPSPRIAILGDMLELGTDSLKEHRRILELALSLPIDRLVLVGPEFEAADSEGQAMHLADADELISWWKKESMEEASIFLKASRGLRLEKFIAEIDSTT